MQHLAQREPANRAVVGGEAAVLEHGLAEQVGGDHGHGHAGVGEGLLEAVDLVLADGGRGTEREQVVIVEGEAVGAELGQARDRLDGVQRGAGRAAERVGPVVTDGPEAEGKFVGGGGRVRH